MKHLHDYEVVRESINGIRERCKECGKTLITKKDEETGRIDNKKYSKEHARDIAQPTGRTARIYRKYYGNTLDGKRLPDRTGDNYIL